MRYYLDCEFNGMGGEFLSLALVPEDGQLPFFKPLYLVRSPLPDNIEPWVANHVLPKMHADYPQQQGVYASGSLATFRTYLQEYLRDDTDVTIITDWPDDIKYFCELILTGPGTMIEVRPSIKFEMHRVDAYPTDLPGAIQHNAYWDAMALRHKLQGGV